jgi:hypothetical protein
MGVVGLGSTARARGYNGVRKGVSEINRLGGFAVEDQRKNAQEIFLASSSATSAIDASIDAAGSWIVRRFAERLDQRSCSAR